MDASMIIALVSTWVTYLFPSLGEYTKYIGPGLMALATGIGIFTNLLPEPGHKYPVPDVSDLQTELHGSGGFILKIATFTRTLTISVNWFVATAVYSWFYTFTTKVSTVFSRFKLKSSPPTPAKA